MMFLFFISSSNKEAVKVKTKQTQTVRPDLVQCVPQGVLVLLQPHRLPLGVFLLSLQHGDGSLKGAQSLFSRGSICLSRLGAALSLGEAGGALTQSLAQTQHTQALQILFSCFNTNNWREEWENHPT